MLLPLQIRNVGTAPYQAAAVATTMYGYSIRNDNGYTVYVKMYDSLAASVTVSTVPTLIITCAANTTTASPVSQAFATGLTIQCTTVNLTGDTTPASNPPFIELETDADLNSRYQSIATAAGTTALVATSPGITEFTGSTTQTVTLPVTTGLFVGQTFQVVNSSTGTVTVKSSGANTVKALTTITYGWFVCNTASGTGSASWTYFGSA